LRSPWADPRRSWPKWKVGKLARLRDGGWGGDSPPGFFLGNHKAVFFEKFTHIKPLRYFGTKQTTDVVQFTAHKKNPKHALYSLQFTVLHATTDRDA